MAAIETKRPGHFTAGIGDMVCPDEWGMDTLPLGSEELYSRIYIYIYMYIYIYIYTYVNT